MDICGRCYADTNILHPAPCEEKPETLHGPIGMYHCPDCGAMVVAGFKHPTICGACLSELTGGENGK